MNYLNKFLTFSLTAFAVALGVTSCEKDGALEDSQLINVLNESSSVDFAENISVGAPKGLSTDLTSKDHSEFTHIFGSSQNLVISNSASETVWEGSYTPGDISTLAAGQGYALPIVLPNGNYTAASSSEGDSQDAVLGFLPYTSSASFSIPPAGQVELAVSHSRGFAVVNVEDALDGSRVSGARVDGTDLIEDERDAFGDYFGYLLPGDKSFEADYLLDDVSTTISGDLTIGAGLAYTINLSLDADTAAVVGSDVTTSTMSSVESAHGALDVNSDGDQLDLIERIITSTQATLDGVADGAPVITEGAWSVTSDIDVTSTSATVTSTEAIEGDQNADGDTLDSLSREDVTTVTSTDGVEVSNTVTGTWTVTDNSQIDLGEGSTTPGNGGSGTSSGTAEVDAADEIVATVGEAVLSGGVSSTVNDGAAVVTLETASSTVAEVTETTTQATLIETTAVIETITTTYAVRINGVEDVPALVAPQDLVETREVTAASSVAGDPIITTREVANPAYVAPVADAADTLGPWIYSNTNVNDDNWDDSAIAFGGTDVQNVRVTRSRQIIINGVEDATPPAGSDNLAGDKTFSNSDYQAPVDPADVWSVTGTYGGETTEGAEFDANSVLGTAAADIAEVTETYDVHRLDQIAAAGNVETLAVNGDDDDLTDSFVDGSTRQIETAAAQVDVLVVVSTGNTRQVANPAYVADEADVWAVTGTYGGGVTEGAEFEANAVTETGAPDSQEFLTVTFDLHRNDVTAAGGNVETLTVNVRPDVAGTATGDTRNIETSAGSTDLVIVSTGNTRQIDNPNYQAGPVDAWVENGGVYTNAAYPGYSFTVAPASFPLSGFLATIEGPNAVNQGGATEAEAIANAQAHIAGL